MLIETYIDPICPWCFIGRRRLARALALRPLLTTEIRWLPFQLNPDMPPFGMDRSLYLALKFGGADRARQLTQPIESLAEREGVRLRTDLILRTPNTVNAHRLLRLADGTGHATDLLDRLFTAYFQLGQDIGRVEVLTELAVDVGMDGVGVERVLTTTGAEAKAVAEAVQLLEAQARRMGVQGVPYAIFDRRFAVAGAQEPETLLPFLDLATVEAMATPPPPIGATPGNRPFP